MCFSVESSNYKYEIETIIYDGYLDMYIATLENGERWAVPRYAVPEDMTPYEFLKEIIYEAG